MYLFIFSFLCLRSKILYKFIFININPPQKISRSITKLDLNCYQVLNHKADEPQVKNGHRLHLSTRIPPVTY